MLKTPTLLSLVAVPLLALLIACGGDDGDSGSDSGGSSPSATSTGSDSSGSSGSSGSGSSGSGSGSSSSSGDFEDCPELEKFVGAAAGGFGPGQDIDDVEINGELFQNMARSAPSEIRSDMQVLADAMGKLFDKLDDLDVDFSNPASFAALTPAQLEELDELSAELDTPRVNQAVEKIEAYFERVCS